MKNWIEKIVAAALTVVFLALIKPTELPALWITGALGIAFYEAALGAVEVVEEIHNEEF